MRTLLAVLAAVALLAPSVVAAGSDCTTRRSGSVVIVTCSNSDNPRAFNSSCRSYKSGNVTKTSCR
jgi:hypothetical protein